MRSVVLVDRCRWTPFPSVKQATQKRELGYFRNETVGQVGCRLFAFNEAWRVGPLSFGPAGRGLSSNRPRPRDRPGGIERLPSCHRAAPGPFPLWTAGRQAYA